MAWKSLVALGGVAAVVVGALLLAVSPKADSEHRAWRPGERLTITDQMVNQTWRWSFRIPNESDDPLHVHASFRFNVTNLRMDPGEEWVIMTWLDVDGTHTKGVERGGSGCCNWQRYRLEHEWTIPPGEESLIEATATNLPQGRDGNGWEMHYDPMEFEVTTTTQSLDWSLAGTGAGLLVAGFGAVAAVAVPWRLRS